MVVERLTMVNHVLQGWPRLKIEMNNWDKISYISGSIFRFDTVTILKISSVHLKKWLNLYASSAKSDHLWLFYYSKKVFTATGIGLKFRKFYFTLPKPNFTRLHRCWWQHNNVTNITVTISPLFYPRVGRTKFPTGLECGLCINWIRSPLNFPLVNLTDL